MARKQTRPETPPPPIARFSDGFGVPGYALRFDPERPAGLAFLSSAAVGARAARRHQRTLATAETLALLGIPKASQALPVTCGRAFDVGGLSLTLQPSGHVLGAAFVEVLLRDGRTLAWVGPWRAGPGLTVQGGELPSCDVLVMHAGFGAPGMKLPPRLTALDQAARFARRTLDAGRTPVLLAEPLGAAQELLARLTEDGVPARLHPAVWRVARRYAALGVELGPIRRYAGKLTEGEVLIAPPAADGVAAALGRPVAVARLTGARDPTPETRIRYSDFGDHAEMVRLATESAAERILVHGTHAVALARALVRLGHRAEALGPADQLDLFAWKD